MITEFRSAVANLLEGERLLDVYEFVPQEVNAYPCIGVGRVSAVPSDEAGVVFNLTLPVYVCGRNQSDDAQDELDKNADQVWTILGGTRTRRAGDLVVVVTSVEPSVIALAGNQNVPAYVLSVESSATTC